MLFTDIVGSTRLKQELGDVDAMDLIQEHHDTVRRILAGFAEAEEIGTAGDEFFIVFSKPSDAVRFSLLLQSAMRALAARSSAPVLDRIGIHVGEVIIVEGEGSSINDLYGMQVDTCARIMSLGQADQILMTRAVFDNSRQVLKGQDVPHIGELLWMNHGAYNMQGVDEPVEVCEVGEVGKGKLTRPPDSAKARRYLTEDSEPVLGWRPAVGQQIPGTNWIVERKLGEGGFGEVWLGRDKTLKTPHVFKFCFRADRVRSLKREVTLFRLLKERTGGHPNIVGVEATFFDEAPYYIVMEYVDGLDLRRWCEARGGIACVPVALRLEIAAQVADALQAAHDSGVIHRDVKPPNILISGKGDDIMVHLTDFGIGQVLSSKDLPGVTRLGFTQTMSGSSPQEGTQLYMAPELMAGKPASIRSDIYSLGVVLFQLLAGDLALPVTTDWARHVADPLLREDLARCFTGDPEARFAGAAQLAANLRSLDQRHAAQRAEEEAASARERLAYQRGVLRTTSVAVFVALLISGLALYSYKEARRAERLAANESAQRVMAQAATEKARHTLSQSDFLQAVSSIDTGGKLDALAHLARSLLFDRQNQASLGCAVSLLTYNDFPLPVFRLEQGGNVWSACYSPGGKRIVTTSKDRSARIWDAETGKPLVVLSGHESFVWYAEFSPDGTRVVTCSQDGTARVWDAETGKPLTPPLAHDGSVLTARFSPDGTRIVTASEDHTARLWDALTGRPVGDPLPHGDAVWSARFNPDGTRVVTASEDRTARLWDARTGQPVGEPMQHLGRVTAARFGPDGKRVVTASRDGTARVWDAETGAPLGRPLRHGDTVSWKTEVSSAEFSPDGRSIATASWDKTARVWDAASGEPLTPPLPHPDFVMSACFSPDGLRLVTATQGDGTARVWDARTGRSLSEPMKHHDYIRWARFDPGGRRVITTSEDHTARVWNVEPGRALAMPVASGHTVTSAGFSPDGARIITSSADGGVRICDAESGVPLAGPVMSGGVMDLAVFSPDGKRILALSREGTACVWDAGTGAKVADGIGGEGTEYTCHFSPDGKRVLTGLSLRVVRLWDVASGRPVGLPMEHPGGKITTAEFSPDGSRIVTASLDHTARVWEADTGKPVGRPMTHAQEVWSARFSPDGSRIVTASEDETARVWDAATGLPVSEEMNNRAVVWRACFSPDGKRVATAAYGAGMARVWDAQSGRPLTQPMRHHDFVYSVVFSPDGRQIATSSKDGTARVWDVETGLPLTEPLPLAEPQTHDDRVFSAAYSPDGKRLLTVADGCARVWDLWPGGKAPEWLPELVEAVGGEHLNDQGVIEAPAGDSAAVLRQLKDRLDHQPANDPWVSWGRWYLADRSARTIAPFAKISARPAPAGR